ncbi:MAG: VOC family protein [Chloroflexi bacterium]|nr:VOC family protein [Chloroflexota bacterium]
MFKRIDHVVIAVKDLEDSAALYMQKYGLKATAPEDVPDLGIRIRKVDVGNSYIELAQPTNPDGPVGKFVANTGEGLYLIAIQVDSLAATVKNLQDKGARLIGAENASKKGARVFVHPKSTHGALLMLME